MFTARSTYRPAVLCVVACALLVAAAPAAAAQPADIHASFAQAAARSHQQQDLRSPDASDPAAKSHQQQDLRSPDASDAAAVDSGTQRQPIKPAPVVHVSGSGSDLDWTLIGFGIAGSLLLVGGIAGLARHSRRNARARLAA